MHLNDLDILYKIQKFFGVGTVNISKNSVHYRVTSLKDLAIICSHFYIISFTSKKYSLIIFNII